MYHLTLTGSLTSKRAMHVPVFRHWKLVRERREFGTQVDKITLDYPLKALSWDDLPKEKEIKLTNDFKVILTKREPEEVNFVVLFQGIPVPGTDKTIALPKMEYPKGRLLAWHTTLWKGVQVDLEGSIAFIP